MKSVAGGVLAGARKILAGVLAVQEAAVLLIVGIGINIMVVSHFAPDLKCIVLFWLACCSAGKFTIK